MGIPFYSCCSHDLSECQRTVFSISRSRSQGCLAVWLKLPDMPGIDLDILELAEVDYSVLQDNCEILALALAKGRHIQIETLDSKDRQYQLDVDLDPWMRMPIISDGIIQDGFIGEMFPPVKPTLRPPENQANGEIVIDGSIPGCIISNGEEIILFFREGRLVDGSRVMFLQPDNWNRLHCSMPRGKQ